MKRIDINLILSSLSKKINGIDICIFSIIILLICFIFLLPEHLKQLLILDRNNLFINQLWTTSWTHLDFYHFFSNITVFALLFWLSLIIFNELNKRKKEYYINLILIILIVPLATSIAFLQYLSIKTGLGFSDIVAATLGLSIYYSIEYFNKGINKKINQHSPITQIGIATLLLITVLSLFTQPIYITVLMLTIILIYTTIKYKLNPNKIINFIQKNPKKFMLIGITIFLLICFPTMTQFQQENGSITNGMAHFLGLYLGIFIPNILTTIQTTIQKYKNNLT